MFERTKLEERLIKAARAGDLLDASEEGDRTVRAAIVRDLLVGRYGAELDPLGIRLRGARITGALDLTDVRSPVPLVLTACEHDDPIILERAQVPYLDLTGSTFPKLEGDDFVCEHDARLSRVSCQQIVLTDGKITGILSLSGARLTAVTGSALLADRLTVGGTLFLNGGFRANSESSSATVRLPGANITGQLSLRDANVRNVDPSGQVFDAASTRVEGDVFLPIRSFTSHGSHPFLVTLSGFSYAFVPRGATSQEWLQLLATHTRTYAAQPYQQLAAVYRAAGHDREVRRILIAQQRDHRRRGDLGHRVQKLLHLLSGAIIGYGHRPWRALAFLAAVCLLAAAVTVWASMLGLAIRPNHPGGTCSPAEAIGLAMDTSVPLLKLGGAKRCEFAATTGWGQAFYLASYLSQALGWAFATLFVAGYTGLVRKTT